MYAVTREAGKFQFIHSCGDVDELFDDLIGIGLDCFNPFQPEVMDVRSLLPAYRGRLSFWGGMSTQKTMPYGNPDEVRAEVRDMIDLGRAGSIHPLALARARERRADGKHPRPDRDRARAVPMKPDTACETTPPYPLRSRNTDPLRCRRTSSTRCLRPMVRGNGQCLV